MITEERRTLLITRLSQALCVWVVIDLVRHRVQRRKTRG